MIVNQANLHGLTVGYSTAFNKSFDTTQSNYQKVATVVPSTTGEQDYKWLGQMPGMREWIGEREVQALAAYDYLIKNKKFEMTIGVPRDDIEDDKYGVYTPLFSNMGEAAALQPDELVFGAMMSGFNEKCYDGLSFFNTAHKVGDATYSNRSNKKLSRESYMEGRSSIMSIKGDKGKSLKLVPDLLVVPPALEETARLHIVIADTSEEKVEEILENFLRNLKKGIDVDGNWVNIVVGEADWVEEGDSILKAKVAVQFDITFEGGIYQDRDIKPMDIGSVG